MAGGQPDANNHNASLGSNLRLAKPPLSLPSSALVLGATSLVGRFLLDRLVASGVKTVAVSRQAQQPRPGVQWLVSDLNSLDLTASSPLPVAFSVSHIWLLAQALPALRAAGVTRLVAFSSTSRFTKTDSPVESEREVVRRLIEGETETKSYCEREGITWTILRPTVIYAEGRDRSITRLANLIKRFGTLPLAGDARGRRQPVHADDLAAGAIAAGASSRTGNRAYDVPGGEILTYRAMIERIFEGIGRKPRILSIPPAFWRVGLSMGSIWMPGVTTEMGSRMSEDLVFDAEPAERDFGWRPRGFRPQFLP